MKKEKVGIVTFHMAENFGSALQAFALEHFLIEIGCQPEIINCIYKADMEKYRLRMFYILVEILKERRVLRILEKDI